MILYLVRHGIATDREDPGCPPDPDRRLTEKGIAKSRDVANSLKAVGMDAEVFLTSPYRRALETAEIFASVFGFSKDRIRTSDLLKPGGSPSAFLRELARIRSAEVICFGHAPNLDGIIAAAVGAGTSFTALKKSGVACLEMDRLAPPRGSLVWLTTPKLLRALAD